MKPALYYAIRRNLYNDVVAITSVKERNDRWFGRYVKDNSATHGSGDIMGKFPTAEAAEAKRRKIADISEEYKAKRKPHNDAVSRLHRDECNAIQAAVNTDV